MLVRQAMQARLSEADAGKDRAGSVRLPGSLKADRSGVRTLMLQRLAASRLFAIGDRAGVLRTDQKRSGRAFRLDVRQRVIVKALVSKHAGKGAVRGEALAKHVAYLHRAGAGLRRWRTSFSATSPAPKLNGVSGGRQRRTVSPASTGGCWRPPMRRGLRRRPPERGL